MLRNQIQSSSLLCERSFVVGVHKNVGVEKVRALMNLISVKAPATRVPLAGQPPDFVDALLWIVAASQTLQIIADQLIQAFPKSLRFFART